MLDKVSPHFWYLQSEPSPLPDDANPKCICGKILGVGDMAFRVERVSMGEDDPLFGHKPFYCCPGCAGDLDRVRTLSMDDGMKQAVVGNWERDGFAPTGQIEMEYVRSFGTPAE